MTKTTATREYIGLKKITAWPEPGKRSPDAETEAGYGVEYEGGYVSWSPADVFEKAYRPVEGMTFGIALEAVRRGAQASRLGWGVPGQFVDLYTPEDGSTMRLPMLCMSSSKSRLSPWLASHSDLLAEDWYLLD